MDVILAGIETMPVKENIKLMCEPGRALVAEAESLIVRVDARRGNNLFINDGSYGMLFDAAHLGFVFPTRIVSRDIDAVRAARAVRAVGPDVRLHRLHEGPVPAAGLGRRGRLHRDRQHGRLRPRHRRPASMATASTTRSSCSIEPMLSMYEAEGAARRRRPPLTAGNGRALSTGRPICSIGIG